MSKLYIGYPKNMGSVAEILKEKLGGFGIIEDLGERAFLFHPVTTSVDNIINGLQNATGFAITHKVSRSIPSEEVRWYVMLGSQEGVVDVSDQAWRARNLF